MNTTKKTTSHTVSAAAAEKTEVVETIATLYTNGVERLAEVQKIGIDLAAKQNAELLDAWKKIARAFPGAPGLVMLDLVSNALDRYADTQKGAIDLVLEQSHALAGLAKERASSTADAVEGAAAIVKQTVDRAVAAEERIGLFRCPDQGGLRNRQATVRHERNTGRCCRRDFPARSRWLG